MNQHKALPVALVAPWYIREALMEIVRFLTLLRETGGGPIQIANSEFLMVALSELQKRANRANLLVLIFPGRC